MATALQPFPPLSVYENSSDIRWRKWINRLENMLVGMDVKDDKRKLHFAGEEVSEIFETLIYTGNDYATAKQKLSDYLLQRSTLSLKYDF